MGNCTVCLVYSVSDGQRFWKRNTAWCTFNVLQEDCLAFSESCIERLLEDDCVCLVQ